jgi:ABC-type antimicrobial peptide transport system permease subunit
MQQRTREFGIRILAVTGLLACLLPAIRASRLDPKTALGLQ